MKRRNASVPAPSRTDFGRTGRLPAGPDRTLSRHEMMDVGRGVAVLGILWLNVFLFALPFEALVIPGIWGTHNLLNEASWDLVSVAVAGVMRGMFSILFGASAMLLLTRAERADDQVTAIDRYFRRLLWLVVFGAVHAYLLIWPHDILYAYGLLGMLIFPFRHVASRKLAVIAALMIAGSSVFTSENVEEIGAARERAEEALTDAGRERLQDEAPLVDELDEWGALDPRIRPAALDAPSGAETEAEDPDVEDAELEALIERLTEEMQERHKGYIDNLVAMAPDSFQQQTTEMVGNHLLDIGAFLLIGMVLYRSGFFHAAWSTAAYRRLALGGYALGLVIGWLTRGTFAHGSELATLSDIAADYGFDLRRLALALANFALVAMLVRSRALRRLRHALGACGRMALSLYIAQTIVCNALFLGYGLSLFGESEHYQLVLVALGLTLLQLAIAPLVLARFGQGPLERLLRRLIDWGRSADERRVEAPVGLAAGSGR